MLWCAWTFKLSSSMKLFFEIGYSHTMSMLLTMWKLFSCESFYKYCVFIFSCKIYKDIESFLKTALLCLFRIIQHVSWLYIFVLYDLSYYYCMLALSVYVMMPLRSSQPMTKTNIGFVMKCEVHVSQITTRSLFEFISAFGTALEMKQNSYKRNLFMSSEMS